MVGINTDGFSLFQLNSSNPHYQTLFNLRALECYVKKMFEKIFSVKDSFTTFEFQERGSLHTHSLIWFDETKVVINFMLCYHQI